MHFRIRANYTFTVPVAIFFFFTNMLYTYHLKLRILNPYTLAINTIDRRLLLKLLFKFTALVIVTENMTLYIQYTSEFFHDVPFI